VSETHRFLLPDLGEGLPDATVVEWLVKEGASVRLDEPLVAMETAKAVVEVPSPCSGVLLRTGGGAGSVIATGALLAEFRLDPNAPQRAAGHDTGHHHAPAPAAQAASTPAAATAGTSAANARSDAGTVVGAVSGSDQLRSESVLSVGGIKAVPAVRALAKKLGVDLTRVTPSGAEGVITLQDVKQAAANPPAVAPTPMPSAAEQAVPAHAGSAARTAPTPASTGGVEAARTPLSATGKPLRTQPPGATATGQPEPLTGVRRNMARVMAQAQAEVVLTTLTDDADLQHWLPGNDLTARLVRALVAACRAEPALNAWFDGANLTRTLHRQVDVGIAVDTPDGLFVPALRNADMLDLAGIREGVTRLRQQVEARALPASELSGYTISLSNFGKFAGRYATPIVVPPTVAILAAGRSRHELVPVMGGVETHRLLPLSLSFDHRCVTGGEAARFLRAVLDDLARAS
jgi:2-oxoisovalerate dehydrogenase E2 component (dihydrolipoyl transacylase)